MIINRLSYYMDKEKINISELSEKTLISRNTISSILNKGNELSAYKKNTIENLCGFFGISIGDLFSFVDESIDVQEIFSIVEKDIKQAPDGKKLFTGDFSLKLKNSYERISEVDLKISCSTGFKKQITNDNGEFDIPYNIYDIEIDRRFFTEKNSNNISETIIQDLFTLTNFLPERIMPSIPSILDGKNRTLDFENVPAFKIKFRYLSYSFIDNVFEREWSLLYSTDKDTISYLPEL